MIDNKKCLKQKRKKKIEKNKEQDDIFYEVDVKNEKTYLTEIYKIINKYIDGIIIILGIDNFYLD